MKPAPNVPGETPSERLSNALRMVLRVSKPDLLKKEARLKRAKEKKRAVKKLASLIWLACHGCLRPYPST